MSGRRLLDAAAILKASRGVVTKHLALRQQQLDNYNKTSSLGNVIKSQTDRVTLTVKAASALAGRFNGPNIDHSTQACQSEWVTPNVENWKGGLSAQHTEAQITDYQREQTPIHSGSEDDRKALDLKTTESQSYSFPDHRRDTEGQEKKVLCSQWTESPPTAISESAVRNATELDVDQEKGSCTLLSPSTSEDTPPLLTINLPKETGNLQESVEDVSDDQINHDVSYSSKPKDQGRLPQIQAASEPEELPEEAYAGIFQSRKTSKMLLGRRPRPESLKELDLAGAKETPVQKSKAAYAADEASSSGCVLQQNVTDSSKLSTDLEAEYLGIRTDENVGELAADIATDASPAAVDPVATSEGLVDALKEPPFEMRESKVPSSRIGRIWQYSGLATSMAFGAVGESIRRATGSTQEAGGSLMLSEANMARLVAKLSKMRGAALKLGQMMSFQDSKMLPKPIHDVLQRVQDSADYMPPSQRNRVLSSNLGPEWRSLFSTFDEHPIAAASIGQVHRATLASTSQSIAVKIQYPGVAASIDSDLSNLAILLTASRLLPKGLYLDKTIANARLELAWECDYIREAEMGTRFHNLLADEGDIYHVPAIVKEASGPQVLTAEFVEGTGVTKGQHFTQEQKDWIGTHILRLCLREITEFKFMQTDPNWTNFLFNPNAHKLELLDFGASRDFPDQFILPYIRTLLAASRGDRKQVRDLSIELGYLTGHESQAMVNAHVNSVLTLAEPFAETAPEVYDFRNQTITDRVRGFIPVMLRERLAPPPEETYSIHRKLSGAFLLCAKLGSRVRCREMFEKSMGKAGML